MVEQPPVQGKVEGFDSPTSRQTSAQRAVQLFGINVPVVYGGLGHLPFTEANRVRPPVGTPRFQCSCGLTGIGRRPLKPGDCEFESRQELQQPTGSHVLPSRRSCVRSSVESEHWFSKPGVGGSNPSGRARTTKEAVGLYPPGGLRCEERFESATDGVRLSWVQVQIFALFCKRPRAIPQEE